MAELEVNLKMNITVCEWPTILRVLGLHCTVVYSNFALMFTPYLMLSHSYDSCRPNVTWCTSHIQFSFNYWLYIFYSISLKPPRASNLWAPNCLLFNTNIGVHDDGSPYHPLVVTLQYQGTGLIKGPNLSIEEYGLRYQMSDSYRHHHAWGWALSDSVASWRTHWDVNVTNGNGPIMNK